MKNNKNLKQKLLYLGIYFFAVVLLTAVDMPCVSKMVLGIPCPGCGMSHALLYLLQLDIVKAFVSHPMFWSLPVLLLYYFKDGNLFRHKGLNKGVFTGIAVGFLLNWVISIARWLLK